ncbi:hypothetical protein H5410_060570 [Solanum commersonii]|uniref:Uncharacterized protein n=1 Tax=Solanum commersonii TaxID=4109 RepID=A0A9J5W6E9_SOLCO|nr:hypothetical protein H5410_060570 [Solanum commersonii]
MPSSNSVKQYPIAQSNRVRSSEGQREKVIDLTEGWIANWIKPLPWDSTPTYLVGLYYYCTIVDTRIGKVGLKVRMVGRLTSWVELAEPLVGSSEVPLLAFNFILNEYFRFVTFGEKPEIAKALGDSPKVFLIAFLSIPLNLFAV